MNGCLAYERTLGDRLLDGRRGLNALKLWGRPTMDGRVPTFGFAHANHAPSAIAEALAAREIYAWSGIFYAVEAVARMGCPIVVGCSG